MIECGKCGKSTGKSLKSLRAVCLREACGQCGKLLISLRAVCGACVPIDINIYIGFPHPWVEGKPVEVMSSLRAAIGSDDALAALVAAIEVEP